jgi:hypothetical protein
MDNSLQELADRIQNSLLIATTEYQEQELYYDLERNKQRLLKLFDVGPRSPAEAREVENSMWNFWSSL